MLRTFNYNENVRLSEHFNSSEFRCKCGKVHNYIIDTILIDKLERLLSALSVSSCIPIIISPPLLSAIELTSFKLV